MSPIRQFAKEHGISPKEASHFNSLAVGRAYAVEHELNGDPAPSNLDSIDKNDNARRWKGTAEKLASQMENLAQHWGFHHLDFGVGLYPTLQKTDSNTDGTVMFPYT